MLNQNRLATLFIIIALILVSCNLTESVAPESATPLGTPTVIIPTDQVNLTLEVQVDTSIQYSTVGQVVKYKFVITVTKNDSVGIPANISVTGVAAVCPPITTVGNLNDRLDAGEKIECTFDYAITQADLDKGSITSLFAANAYSVNSNQVTTTVPTVPSKALTITKSANPTTYSQIGQTITYTYIIKNSGTQPIGPAQFTVTDTAFTAPINCGNSDTTLAPSLTVTCSATYTVTQADMNAASFATNATAAAPGVGPSQPANATVTKSATPGFTAGTTIQHKVIKGEWLWQIARCYGADPRKVSEANLPTPSQIEPDIMVTVPNIGSVGKIYGPPCVATHTVQSGDTWSSIAQKYNADVTVLQMVNLNLLTVGSVIKVPLNSAGAFTTPLTPVPTTAVPTTTSTATQCVDVTRTIKLTSANSGLTHFNVCGTVDAGRMKIATIKVSQLAAEVPTTNLISQDITVSVVTSTPLNDANSLIVADMNYDGNDDFRVLVNVPAGPNLPFIYYLYDPATNKFVFNDAYGKIISPEFPGNNEIRSQWRESATKWGIDTYTVANNLPRLTKRETWEAISTTQARHVVTIFNADGTSQVTIDETIPLPTP
jgi:uncharacterized repeat protein (TIGR01451 family)